MVDEKKKKESSRLQVRTGSSVKDENGEFRVKVQVITPWVNDLVFRDGDFNEIDRATSASIGPDGRVIRTLAFPHSFAGRDVDVVIQTTNDAGKLVEEVITLNMPTQFRKSFRKSQFSPAKAWESLKEALTWQKIKRIVSHFGFVLLMTLAILFVMSAANGKASVIIGFFLGLLLLTRIGIGFFPFFLVFLAWCWFNPAVLSGGVMSALWTAVFMGEFFYIVEELFHRKYEESDGDTKLVRGFNFYPKVPIGICLFMAFLSFFDTAGDFVPDRKPEKTIEEGINLSEIDVSQYRGDEIDISEWRGDPIDLSSGDKLDSFFSQSTSWADRVFRGIGSIAYWLLVLVCLVLVGIPGDIMDWWSRRSSRGASDQAVEKGLLAIELWRFLQYFWGSLTGKERR